MCQTPVAVPALAIAATAGVALVLDWIVWEPMRRQQTSTLQLFLVAISLAMIIRYTIQFFAGSQPRSLGQDVLSEIVVGPFHLGALQSLALIVGVAAASLVGLGLAFTRFRKRWKPVVGFAILILMLLIMPRGILGSGRARS
jgi:branched-subunit amino acid ABC-type transport system permease component